MQEGHALTVLNNLARALASKERNDLGFKVASIGSDSFSAKCNVCKQIFLEVSSQ